MKIFKDIINKNATDYVCDVMLFYHGNIKQCWYIKKCDSTAQKANSLLHSRVDCHRYLKSHLMHPQIKKIQLDTLWFHYDQSVCPTFRLSYNNLRIWLLSCQHPICGKACGKPMSYVCGHKVIYPPRCEQIQLYQKAQHNIEMCHNRTYVIWLFHFYVLFVNVIHTY